jgi:hypothetical protein
MDGWSGVANLSDVAGTAPRDGISKLSTNDPSAWAWDVDTLVHEVGHNHGREHAPCGDPAGADQAFPYPQAGIGVAGYDIGTQTLIDPGQVDAEYGMATTDFMSYCLPQWWSDYSWQAIIERVRVTQAAKAEKDAWNHEVLRGFVYGDGRVTWSKVPAPSSAPTWGVKAGSLTMKSSDGSVTTATIYEHRIADAGVTVIEADITQAPAFEAFEVELDTGRHIAATRAEIQAPTKLGL